ncbi:Flp pilus assembly protein CpaB [Roseinatronobacter alkalisoli]|uniref:Flp pilus assembly protein CpaB n=1 Tax=Roseinatronobacter alkalisoli TaxID=3028235 RepID=A0ABT5T9E7_9RHOB|nr:Flp pilus assembly protein CpaB [Roseinatronobacter sp. HJB301]MDD7971745.1 Flp pilus assembly protein CpaB [Roseinatronobacter sp. HJB301]
MRLLFAAILLAGLGLAGFAVYQTQQYVGQMERELVAARSAQSAGPETVEIYLTSRNLRYGERMVPADLITAPFPANAVPVGSFTDIDAIFPDGIAHRTVLRAMDTREPLLTSKLTEPGKEAGITSHLTPGKRAFTIDVNHTSGVAGFLRPGDHVDVFWTGRSRESGEMTSLIEPRMRIIAVDQSADMERRSEATLARNVTVEALPEQAAALAQAQSSGRLSLALVGINDDSISGAIEMTQDRLLGVVREEHVAVEPERTCHVRTRRGNQLVLIETPCTN